MQFYLAIILLIFLTLTCGILLIKSGYKNIKETEAYLSEQGIKALKK